MLLSHNFNLYNGELPAFNREEFAEIFIEELEKSENIKCSFIENPHWIVEILFSQDEYTAEEIGKICGKILREKRQEQSGDLAQGEALRDRSIPDLLLLGGKKTTPATSSLPTSLQPGDWGVDVVETPSASTFLSRIQWDTTLAQKPIDRVFKIEFIEA